MAYPADHSNPFTTLYQRRHGEGERLIPMDSPAPRWGCLNGVTAAITQRPGHDASIDERAISWIPIGCMRERRLTILFQRVPYSVKNAALTAACQRNRLVFLFGIRSALDDCINFG